MRKHFTVIVLTSALSACATIPGGPPYDAGDVTPTAAAALRGALKRNQEDAKRLEGEGRLSESLERWKIVLTIDPQHAEAKQKQADLGAKIKGKAQQHIAAGKEQLQRRDKQAAQREFLAALRLDPMNKEALEKLYQSDEQLGEQTAFARPLSRGKAQPKTEAGRPEAKPMPEEEEEEEESGEEVSFAEAAEIFRRGDYLAAIDAFSRVLAQQPGMREAVEYQKLAYYNQGVAYMQKESYAEALRMFEHVKRMQPDFKRVGSFTQTAREKLADQHYLAGIRQFREQKLREAIEEWDQALTLNPRLESAKRSRERAKRLLKSLEEVK